MICLLVYVVVFVFTDKQPLLTCLKRLLYSWSSSPVHISLLSLSCTVQFLWRNVAFLSLFNFTDDGGDTGVHADRAGVIDSSVNSNVINISRLSSM